MINPAILNFKTYLPETNAYLNSDSALSSLTTAKKDGIDRWFKDLQGFSNDSYTTYNVWSRIVAIYPMIGGTSTSVAKNAKSPGTYDLTHSGSPTINSNGIAYNGSSQFSDTGYIPPSDQSTNDLLCVGIHRRDSNDDINATCGIASGGNTYFIIRSDNFRSMQMAGNGIVSAAGTLGVNALWHGSYASTTTANAYRNGVNIKANSGLTITNTGNRSFYIGGFHLSSSVGYGGANTVDYVWLGTNYNWTDSEQLFMYNAFNALQTILGR